MKGMMLTHRSQSYQKNDRDDNNNNIVNNIEHLHSLID